MQFLKRIVNYRENDLKYAHSKAMESNVAPKQNEVTNKTAAETLKEIISTVDYFAIFMNKYRKI